MKNKILKTVALVAVASSAWFYGYSVGRHHTHPLLMNSDGGQNIRPATEETETVAWKDGFFAAEFVRLTSSNQPTIEAAKAVQRSIKRNPTFDLP